MLRYTVASKDRKISQETRVVDNLLKTRTRADMLTICAESAGDLLQFQATLSMALAGASTAMLTLRDNSC